MRHHNDRLGKTIDELKGQNAELHGANGYFKQMNNDIAKTNKDQQHQLSQIKETVHQRTENMNLGDIVR